MSFTGNMRIATNKGWIRLDSLFDMFRLDNPVQVFTQDDKGEISLTVPEKVEVAGVQEIYEISVSSGHAPLRCGKDQVFTTREGLEKRAPGLECGHILEFANREVLENGIGLNKHVVEHYSHSFHRKGCMLTLVFADGELWTSSPNAKVKTLNRGLVRVDEVIRADQFPSKVKDSHSFPLKENESNEPCFAKITNVTLDLEGEMTYSLQLPKGLRYFVNQFKFKA